MAKIFTSYKHEDPDVYQDGVELAYVDGRWQYTVRSYVDNLSTRLAILGHTNKCEAGDEDISHLTPEVIAQKLNTKIYDSTITIVLISKNMKKLGKLENDQWIHREISYSLTENNRGGRISHTNAVLAVVIPDKSGSYGYFIEHRPCNTCISWKHNELFNILGKNMFNRKVKKTARCTSGVCGSVFHEGNDHSYIHPVTWDNFINDINGYINLSTQIKENFDDYDVKKEIAN